MDWAEIGAWFVNQTSAWITLVCAIIIVVGFFIIGRGKKKRLRG